MKVAGFGYCQMASLSSLAELLVDASRALGTIDALAAMTDKSELVTDLGRQSNLPVLLFDSGRLSGIKTLTQSQPSLRARGTGSVAEAVALLGAGRGARLVAGRAISEDRLATIAVAEGATQ